MFVLGFGLRAAAETSGPDAEEAAGPERVVVHRTLPPYLFSVEEAGPSTVLIKIRGGPKSYHGQTIRADVENEKYPGFETFDVNLDGYTDFRVVTLRGQHGNYSYAYWTFNPRRRVFEEALVFDDITSVDKKRRLLLTHWGGKNPEESTDYFSLRRGRLFKVKSTETLWAREVRDIVPARYADDTPVTITQIYHHGRLQRTFFRVADLD